MLTSGCFGTLCGTIFSPRKSPQREQGHAHALAPSGLSGHHQFFDQDLYRSVRSWIHEAMSCWRFRFHRCTHIPVFSKDIGAIPIPRTVGLSRRRAGRAGLQEQIFSGPNTPVFVDFSSIIYFAESLTEMRLRLYQKCRKGHMN